MSKELKSIAKQILIGVVGATLIGIVVAAVVMPKTRLVQDFIIRKFANDSYYGITRLPFNQYVLHQELPLNGEVKNYYIDLEVKDHGKTPRSMVVLSDNRVAVLWCEEPFRDQEPVLISLHYLDTNKWEEISRFHTSGEIDREMTLSEKDGMVYMTEVRSTAIKESTVIQTAYAKDEEKGIWESETVTAVSWSDSTDPLEISVTSGGDIWAVNESGDLFYLDEGIFYCIFENDETKVSAANVGISCHNGLFTFYNIDEDLCCFVGKDGFFDTMYIQSFATMENEGFIVKKVFASREEKRVIGEIRDTRDQLMLVFMDDHGTEYYFSQMEVPFWLCVPSIVIAAVSFALVAIFFVIVLRFAVQSLKREDVVIPTTLMIVITAVPVLVIGLLLARGSIYNAIENHWINQYSRVLVAQADITSLKVEPDKFSEWPVDSDYFRSLSLLLDATSTNDDADEYVNVKNFAQVEHKFYTIHNDVLYRHGGFTISTVPARYYLTASQNTLLESVFEHPEKEGMVLDDGADQLVVFRLIHENDEIVGAVGCMMSIEKIKAVAEKNTSSLITVIAMVLVLLCGITLVYIAISLKPLSKMTKSIREIEEVGNAEKISVKSTTDIEAVIALYNRLTSRIEIYERNRKAMDDQFGNFIPLDFLEEMDAKTGNVKLGEGLLRTGTIIHIFEKKLDANGISVPNSSDKEYIATTEKERTLALNRQVELLQKKGAELFNLSRGDILAAFNGDEEVDTGFLEKELSDFQTMEVFRGTCEMYISGIEKRMHIEEREKKEE